MSHPMSCLCVLPPTGGGGVDMFLNVNLSTFITSYLLCSSKHSLGYPSYVIYK